MTPIVVRTAAERLETAARNLLLAEQELEAARLNMLRAAGVKDLRAANEHGD